MNRKAICVAVGVASCAAAFSKEIVIYDAAVPCASAVSTGNVFSVAGSWDISDCGEFEITFERPSSGVFSVTMENAVTCYPKPGEKGSGSRGLYKIDAAFWGKPVSSIRRPIPPPMPFLQEAVSRMDHVAPQGLFAQVWPSKYWTCKEAGSGNRIWLWSLNPSNAVVKVSVANLRGKAPPPVKRIVAYGPANKAVYNPEFANLPPDKFFPLVDKYGQFRLKDWLGKIKGDADLAAAKTAEDADLAAHPCPNGRDKWGGWADGPKFEATGHFYVRKVDGKWWFVDPEGCLWWSHGPVRVSASCGMTPYKGRENHFEFLPDADSPFAEFYHTRDELMWPYYIKRGCTNTYDFTSANLYRKYGKNWREVWSERVHRRLRSWGANTIANSSDARVMHLSRTPYCDRFEIKARTIKGAENVIGWWPFRDPFDSSFRENVRAQLVARRSELDDPWCFGLFVDNELQWGDDKSLGRWTWESPDDQPAKIEFRRRLAAKGVTEPTDADFCAFSLAIANEYFSIVRDEIKKAAPHKLYMGCRFSGSAEWVIRAAAPYVDIMSFNCYRRDLYNFDLLPSDIDKPVVIGEFHFGALDRGPIRTGIIHLKDQAERGETYKRYLESALRDNRIVGAHWHQYSDDVSTGRFDGENFQIGWVDICDTPYPETIAAVRWVGDNMYGLRYGKSQVNDK